MEVVRSRFQKCERKKFLSTPLSIPLSSHISYSSAIAFIIRESENGELCVLLTKRASSLSTFASDVCLPGGMYDTLDSDAVTTALRESQEEVGIAASDLTYINTLPAFCTGLGAGKPDPIAVTPVVFWLNKDIKLQVNRNEVDTTFWAPLSFFLRSDHHQTETFTLVSGAIVTLIRFTFFDPASQRSFMIYGCTGNICVTASSIALNTSPEFPFTGLAFYWTPDNEVVFAEVSTTPLTSLPQTEDCKFVPYIIKYNSKL